MRVGTTITAAALLCVSACSSSSSAAGSASTASAVGTDTSTGSATPVEKMSVSIAMGSSYTVGLFSPLYYGLDRGYWSNRGIDATITPGSGSATVVEQVSSGKFDFAFLDTATAAGLIGKGAKVKVIAEMQNKSDIGIICNSMRNIKTPADLAGKSVARTAGDSIDYLFPAFASGAGISLNSFKSVNVRLALKASSLINGLVDCETTYTSFGPTTISSSSKGAVTATALPFSKYGVDVVGYGLIGNTDFMTAHPVATKEVVAGFIESMYQAFLNPEASNAAGEAHNPTAPSAPLLAELKAWVVDGLQPGWVSGQPLGYSDPASWTTALENLQKYNGLANTSPSLYYTNEYIPSDAPKLPLSLPYS